MDKQERGVPPKISARVGVVVAIDDLSYRYRRITLGGADCANFPFNYLGVADHVKLVFPEADGKLLLPDVSGPRPVWNERATAIRDYTVRAVDHDAGTVTFDMIMHGHGAAASWATTAQLGHRLGILGPRGSRPQPENFERYVLLVDETALPAAARWIEELPAKAQIGLHCQIEDIADVIQLPTRETMNIHWYSASQELLLAEAVLPTNIDSEKTFVWCAGEAGLVVKLRHRIADMWGIDTERMKFSGYWRLGEADFDHHAPLEGEPAQS
ncbi:MAG: siderophore-interacting protein [Propionibacteriaceae bacterium]